jgi:hypothetical protein
MQEVNHPTPDCPAQLLRINEVQKELESPQAFAELVSDCQDDFDPTPTQGLNAAIMIVGQLAKFNFDVLANADLDPWQEELWRTDYELLKKAQGLLRQVSQD